MIADGLPTTEGRRPFVRSSVLYELDHFRLPELWQFRGKHLRSDGNRSRPSSCSTSRTGSRGRRPGRPGSSVGAGLDHDVGKERAPRPLPTDMVSYILGPLVSGGDTGYVRLVLQRRPSCEGRRPAVSRLRVCRDRAVDVSCRGGDLCVRFHSSGGPDDLVHDVPARGHPLRSDDLECDGAGHRCGGSCRPRRGARDRAFGDGRGPSARRDRPAPLGRRALSSCWPRQPCSYATSGTVSRCSCSSASS